LIPNAAEVSVIKQADPESVSLGRDKKDYQPFAVQLALLLREGGK
jgi:hypothetical protein